MKLLVIGNGGREHALAWKLAQSSKVETVFVAPGNAGTAIEPKLQNVALTAHQDLIDFCRNENIAFTVVGPEAPLAAGVVNDFRAAGLKIFGRLNTRLSWRVQRILLKHLWQNITFQPRNTKPLKMPMRHMITSTKKVRRLLLRRMVWLPAKGVIVAMTLDEAHAAIDDMLLGNKMGNAGARVVIEDFLQGEEASFIVMVDGNHVFADGNQSRL